jgi:hypothetical protein
VNEAKVRWTQIKFEDIEKCKDELWNHWKAAGELNAVWAGLKTNTTNIKMS